MIHKSLLKLNWLEPFLKQVVMGNEKWIAHNNIRHKRSWCGPDESSQSVAKTDHFFYIQRKWCLVCGGIGEMSCASVWSDYQRQEILHSIRKFEASSCGKAAGIGEQESLLPSEQRQTIHCFGNQAEIKKLWLGSHISTVFPRYCAVGLLPVSIAPKQSQRIALWFDGWYPEVPGGLFRAEVTWLLRKWNYVSSKTLAEDCWSRWTIYSGLNKSLGTINFCFNVGQKNHRT